MLKLATDLRPGPVNEMLGPLAALVMVVVMVGFGVYMTLSIRGKIARRAAARPSPRELVEQMRTHPRILASDDARYMRRRRCPARRRRAGTRHRRRY